MQATALSNDKAWMAADLANEDRWIHRLSTAEISDVDQALAATKRGGQTIETLTRDNFKLEVLPKTLEKVLEKLEDDLGLYVLRGLPVTKYTKAEQRLIYWGVGLYLGTPVTQSSKGDVLGDVKNFGDSVVSKTGRGYMSRERLGYHADTSDVVGLFVMQTAKSGGLSMFCSAVAIRDEIAEKRPDLFEVLQQPFYWSWKGQEAQGELPYYQQPIYSFKDGKFSSRFIRTHITAAQDFPEVPRLTDKQKEAMDLLVTLANDERFHYAMMFEPGDFQFLNNHTTYHARTEFDDYEEEEKRRHLLRMWLAVPNSRPLDDSMRPIFQDPRPGAVRGGFPSRSGKIVYETKVSEF